LFSRLIRHIRAFEIALSGHPSRLLSKRHVLQQSRHFLIQLLIDRLGYDALCDFPLNKIKSATLKNGKNTHNVSNEFPSTVSIL